jgi:hypothetical protein
MKNSMQIIIKTISVIFITTLLSCNNSNPSTPINDPVTNDVKPLQEEDNCCDVPYPATQIGIDGDHLLQFFDIEGGLNLPFKLKFNVANKPNYAPVSQAYLDYVKALHPCATGIGSLFVISQGTNPGHTQRRMTQPKHLGFFPNGGGAITYIGGPSFFDSYYQNPTPLPTSVGYSTSNSLHPNVIYGIEYGVWIDGCDSDIPKAVIDKCFKWGNYQTFRIQSNPSLLKNGEHYVVLEILDEHNNVVESKKINLKPKQ